MSLSLEDIDRRIAGLSNELDATGASLADLDGDVTLKLLASATLSGQTATEWSRASARLALLWACYGALKDKLAQVVALRGARARLKADQLADLAAQLQGDSIVLPADPGVPVARNLTGTSRMASIAWVQSTMATWFHDLATLVDRVGTAWATLPTLDALDRDLRGAAEAAAQLGVAPPPEGAAASEAIRQLRDRLKSDPLAADLSSMARLTASVRSATEAVQALRAARDQLTGRLAAAAAGLSAIASLIEQARSAGALAAQKIAGTPVQAGGTDVLTDRLAHLQVNLANIAGLTGDRWQEAGRLLGQLEQQSAALRNDATAARSAGRDPLALRDELRGRLDAYHAKALAVGRAEDAHLTDLYDRAKGLLYTAPCDLAEAELAVRAYSSGLTPVPARPMDPPR